MNKRAWEDYCSKNSLRNLSFMLRGPGFCTHLWGKKHSISLFREGEERWNFFCWVLNFNWMLRSRRGNNWRSYPWSKSSWMIKAIYLVYLNNISHCWNRRFLDSVFHIILHFLDQMYSVSVSLTFFTISFWPLRWNEYELLVLSARSWFETSLHSEIFKTVGFILAHFSS